MFGDPTYCVAWGEPTNRSYYKRSVGGKFTRVSSKDDATEFVVYEAARGVAKATGGLVVQRAIQAELPL